MAFAASKAFYGVVMVDQIMQACHLKDLTWSDNDNNMYLGLPLRLVILRRKEGGGTYPLQTSLPECNTQGLQVYVYQLKISGNV